MHGEKVIGWGGDDFGAERQRVGRVVNSEGAARRVDSAGGKVRMHGG